MLPFKDEKIEAQKRQIKWLSWGHTQMLEQGFEPKFDLKATIST